MKSIWAVWHDRKLNPSCFYLMYFASVWPGLKLPSVLSVNQCLPSRRNWRLCCLTTICPSAIITACLHVQKFGSEGHFDEGHSFFPSILTYWKTESLSVCVDSVLMLTFGRLYFMIKTAKIKSMKKFVAPKLASWSDQDHNFKLTQCKCCSTIISYFGQCYVWISDKN